ncbi:MAG: VOC family protein, partial [Micromonosporaceae bacterium]
PAARGGAARAGAPRPQVRQSVRAMQTAQARAASRDPRMMTAMSKRLESHSDFHHGNVNVTVRTHGHLMAATVVALLGVFVTTAGAGSGNGFVTAIGVGIVISALIFGGFTTVQRRMASMVPGTAHVVSASSPPVGATHGRCDLHLVVQAPRLTATAVRYRAPSVPVAKWPTPGATLPVAVDPREPRELRIRWDRVAAHSEATAPTPTPAATPTETTAAEPTAPAAESAPGTRYDDELQLLADAAGVSAAGTETIPATTSAVVPAGEASTAAESAGTGGYTPLSELFGSPDDDPIDLSFLDPPRLRPESDPLLVEYGSPIREVGVTLIVSDLQTSLEFYRDVLGFFEIESGPDMVLLEARTGRVVLRQRPDAQPKPPRLMHLTLEVNDIDTAHRTLTKRGVEFIDEPRAVLKGEMLELWAVSFHDPDGHGVALTSWLPREETSE